MTTESFSETSDRSKIRRHAERTVGDDVGRILQAGHVAHVGFAVDDQPFVIPMTYHYDPANPRLLYLHGIRGGRLPEHLFSGAPVCVTVTLVDGLVYSKYAPDHSLNYRSAVIFGKAREVTDPDEKSKIFNGMIGRYFPGRTAEVHFASSGPKDLKRTRMVAVEIEEWSGKERTGPPLGEGDSDPAAPGTAGVVSLRD